MTNAQDTIKNAVSELIENTRFLSKEIINKILFQEAFTTPAISSFGMDSFKMSAPVSFRS